MRIPAVISLAVRGSERLGIILIGSAAVVVVASSAAALSVPRHRPQHRRRSVRVNTLFFIIRVLLLINREIFSSQRYKQF
jgi:hypothetical protein